MLELALSYGPALQQEYFRAIQQPRCFYLHSRAKRDYSLSLENHNGERLQYVSVKDGRVLGFMECSLNRGVGVAHSFWVINFHRDSEFSADMFRFIDMIFNRFGLKKLVWNVIVGNPAQLIYDKLAKLYDIREVGVFKQDVLLDDGKLYDIKYYEMFAESFNKSLSSLGVDAPHLYRKESVK